MRFHGTMYPERGKGIPWTINVRMKQLTPLPDRLLVDKTKAVLKHMLWEETGRGSISILFLEPGAAVRRHKHETDCEFYITWNAHKKLIVTEHCDVGESHELINESMKCWGWCISVKFDKS